MKIPCCRVGRHFCLDNNSCGNTLPLKLKKSLRNRKKINFFFKLVKKNCFTLTICVRHKTLKKYALYFDIVELIGILLHVCLVKKN